MKKFLLVSVTWCIPWLTGCSGEDPSKKEGFNAAALQDPGAIQMDSAAGSPKKKK